MMTPSCWTDLRRTMLSVLLLSALCSCLHEYHLVDEPKTWKEAQKYCKQRYSDLATIDNAEDMNRLVAVAGSGYEGKVWIGLRDFPSRWRWSLADRSFYGDGEYKFSRWNAGQPDKTRKRGRLCVVVRNGTWYDYWCNTTFSFVCYDKKLIDSPSKSNEGFVFINQTSTWWSAQTYCRKKHTNLASVRNDHENSVIQELVGNDQFVIIGRYRQTWAWWADHSRSTFENWVRGHPRNVSESCAASVFGANHTGEWVEDNCFEKLHFMCHNKRRQVFHFKLTARESTMDLNDPAVTAAILNLVEEKLKEKGFTRDLNISWIKKPDENIFHKEEKNDDLV